MINEFLKKYFPKLNDFFTRNDFSISNFVHKWLVTIFANGFMEETTYLIWDFLFLEGNIVIIKTCLIIFCILKRKLLKYEHNFEELFSILTFGTEKIEPKTPTLLYGLCLKKFEFTDEYIEKTRELLSISVIKNIDNDNLEKFKKNKKLEEKREGENKKDNLKCNENWPICEHKKLIKEPILVLKYLVLHNKNTPLTINDYFFNYTNNQNKKIIQEDEEEIETEEEKTKEESMKEDDYYNILMERHEHSCVPKKDEVNFLNYSNCIFPKFEKSKINIFYIYRFRVC